MTPSIEARKDLVAFLNEIENASADKVNPAFKSKYASLAEVLDTIKAIAKKHHLAFFQQPTSDGLTTTVTVFFLHENGESIVGGNLSHRTEGLTPQQLGSALTYLRRQTAQTACAISVDIDDDGAVASQPTGNTFTKTILNTPPPRPPSK